VGVRDHGDDIVALALEGELDLARAPLLERELESERARNAATLVIDLRELQFIDSTGLRTIFEAHGRVRVRGQEFAITRGSEQVQRLLAITGLGGHLPVIDSPEQASP
jgi:anti-anti-sigma factor